MASDLRDFECRRIKARHLTGVVATVLVVLGGVSVFLAARSVVATPERLIVTTGTVVEHGRGNIIGEYTDVAAEGETGEPIIVILGGTVGAVGEELTFTYNPSDPLGNGQYFGSLGVREPQSPLKDFFALFVLGAMFVFSGVVLIRSILVERRHERQ